MRVVAVLALLFAVASAQLSAAAADPQAQQLFAAKTLVADKTRALANAEQAIKNTEARQVSLKKDEERLKGRMTPLQDAIAELAKLKSTRDQAEATVISTARRVANPNGGYDIILDPVAVKAQGIAQKADNAARRDYAGVEDQLAQLKGQLSSLEQQQETLAKRLETQTADRDKAAAALDEAKAKLETATAGNAGPAPAPAQ